MPIWVLVLIIVCGSLIVLTGSWWGARRLRHLHTRSAVADLPHAAPEKAHKIAVVLNPIKSGAEEARLHILRSAALAGLPEPLFLHTTAHEPGYAQARQALDYGADVVLVGGGDGTVRAVAEVLRHTSVPMGVIPLGTGNLLARNLHMDVNDIQGNVQTALFGAQRHIDTATMALENSVTGHSSVRTFLVIAGIGMDAEVVGDTNASLKKSLGWLAYSEAGVRHLPGRRKRMSIAVDGTAPQQRKVRSVLFANCGLLPGGIDFIPGALIDDGLLDVVVVSPRSAIGWLIVGAKILLRHNGRVPMIDFYRTESLTIRTAMPEETQVDGDPSGKATKVTVTVEPKALLVRVKD